MKKQYSARASLLVSHMQEPATGKGFAGRLMNPDGTLQMYVGPQTLTIAIYTRLIGRLRRGLMLGRYREKLQSFCPLTWRPNPIAYKIVLFGAGHLRIASTRPLRRTRKAGLINLLVRLAFFLRSAAAIARRLRRAWQSGRPELAGAREIPPS